MVQRMTREDSLLEEMARLRYVEYPADTHAIAIKLVLDIVDIPEHSYYPLGLAMHYYFKNNTSRPLFMNFRPVFVTALKDGRQSFFLKHTSPALSVGVPDSISQVASFLPCDHPAKMELRKSLGDSLFTAGERLSTEQWLFTNSFVFLGPGETYECTENITGLLFQDDSLAYKGDYQFYLMFDGARDTTFYGYKVPKKFSGYRHYEGKAISNPVYFEMR
jgi:hypothetical protein